MPTNVDIIKKLMADAKAKMDYYDRKIAEFEAHKIEVEAQYDALEDTLPEPLEEPEE